MSYPTAGAVGHDTELVMERRTYLLIWLVSLFTLSAVAEVFPSPGYMDSYYYYHVAANLARGRGLVEDFVWNYLSLPAAVPQPANLYWMPLTSFVAAPFLAVLGVSFRAAQLPFILLASLVPAVTAGLAWQVLRDARLAISAAFFTLFAGFYFSYWPAVDSFASFALAATAALVLMDRMLRPAARMVQENQAVVPPWPPSRNGKHQHGHPAVGSDPFRRVVSAGRTLAGAGAIRTLAAIAVAPRSFAERLPSALVAAAGCGAAIAAAHLARADGLLLLGVVLLLALGRRPRRVSLSLALVVAACYLTVIAPWLLRNATVAGSPLSEAGARTIWLRSYDEMFSFLAQPTPAEFLEWGIANILWSRLVALVQNLSAFFGGAFHLAPFAALGLWSLRRLPQFRPFFIYAALLYLAHSLVFAFPGPRGSMLHSGVALLPWLAIASVVGLDQAVAWAGARLPHWNVPRAQRNFALLALAGCALVGVFFTMRNTDLWTRDYTRYVQLAAWAHGTPPGTLILVANPPAYAYTSGRLSLVTPSDGVEAVLAAADRYGAGFLALEIDHARLLDGLYEGRETHPRLERLEDVGLTRLYAVRPASDGGLR